MKKKIIGLIKRKEGIDYEIEYQEKILKLKISENCLKYLKNGLYVNCEYEISYDDESTEISFAAYKGKVTTEQKIPVEEKKCFERKLERLPKENTLDVRNLKAEIKKCENKLKPLQYQQIGLTRGNANTCAANILSGQAFNEHTFNDIADMIYLRSLRQMNGDNEE